MSEESRPLQDMMSNDEKETEKQGLGLVAGELKIPKINSGVEGKQNDSKRKPSKLKNLVKRLFGDRKTFWTAFQGLAVLLGVMVAIFLPFIIEYSRNDNMEELVEAEIKKNYEIIKKATSTENIVLDGPLDGEKITPSERNKAFRPLISLDIWHEFQYQLASARPQSFAEYNAMNRQVEEFVSPPAEDDRFKLILQTMAAKEFVKLYESSKF
jgi:hypothetical protein